VTAKRSTTEGLVRAGGGEPDILRHSGSAVDSSKRKEILGGESEGLGGSAGKNVYGAPKKKKAGLMGEASLDLKTVSHRPGGMDEESHSSRLPSRKAFFQRKK